MRDYVYDAVDNLEKITDLRKGISVVAAQPDENNFGDSPNDEQT